MYLGDTNVISEARKGAKANPGVVDFFKQVIAANEPVYLAAVSVGELRRGVDIIRHRGDLAQAKRLEAWLTIVLEQFGENILAFDADAARVWGRLRVPNPDHDLDKQIAATAPAHDAVGGALLVAHRRVAAAEGAKREPAPTFCVQP